MLREYSYSMTVLLILAPLHGCTIVVTLETHMWIKSFYGSSGTTPMQEVLKIYTQISN